MWWGKKGGDPQATLATLDCCSASPDLRERRTSCVLPSSQDRGFCRAKSTNITLVLPAGQLSSSYWADELKAVCLTGYFMSTGVLSCSLVHQLRLEFLHFKGIESIYNIGTW